MCDLVWVKIASIIVMQFFSPLLVIERWLSKKKKKKLVMERLQANALLRRNFF